jgi:hypothetical protein
LRGGSWNYNPQNLRAARRNRNNTENQNNNIGFRVASMTAARAARITVLAAVLGSSRAVHDDNGRGKWFAPVTALVPVLGDACAPAGAKVTFWSLPISMNARRTGPAIEAHYRFLEWLIPAVERRARPKMSASAIPSIAFYGSANPNTSFRPSALVLASSVWV